MSASIIDIADAVVAKINNGSYSQAIAAERKHLHFIERNNLALACYIVPKGESSEVFARCLLNRDVSIDVVVVGPCVDESTAAGLSALVEEIKQDLRDVTMSGASWSGEENDPLYSLDEISSSGTFISVITENYRILDTF